MLNTRTSLLSIMLMLLIGMVNSIDLSAQDNKDVFESYKLLIESKFNSTRAHQDKIFSNFRDSINKAFSTFLLKEWDQATMSEYIPNPNKPEPKPIIDTSKVISSDARLLTKEIGSKEILQDESIDLILTSPPYAGAQKYIRSSWLNLWQ